MPKSTTHRSAQARVIGLPFDAQLQFEQPTQLTPQEGYRRSLLLVCDQIPPSADLMAMLSKMFDVKVVTDPIAGLLALQSNSFEQVVIMLETVQSNLWVMLRSLDSRSKGTPLPMLLFSPGMEASQMQKAYGLGVLFCCNRQLDARDISNQLTAFAAFHDRLKQSILNKAGLHDGLLRAPEATHDFLHALNAIIKEKFTQSDLSVHDLANELGLSISTLERKSLQLTGMRPKAYLNEHRLLFAYQYITNTNCSIMEASRKSGFASSSYFSVKFMSRFKMRPSDLMRSEKRSA